MYDISARFPSPRGDKLQQHMGGGFDGRKTAFPSPRGDKLQRAIDAHYAMFAVFPSPRGDKLQPEGFIVDEERVWFPSPRGDKLQRLFMNCIPSILVSVPSRG